MNAYLASTIPIRLKPHPTIRVLSAVETLAVKLLFGQQYQLNSPRLMPLFHRQYQLNSPRLNPARLGLVAVTFPLKKYLLNVGG